MEERTVFQPSPGGPLRAGVRLNGVYEIERLIGEGGMGEVYKGFNIQTHDPVAIKMLRPEMARNTDAMALFRREASALHSLQHEAIVRYYVFSVDPDIQRPYLAMEFVDGVSLARKLTGGALSLAEVLVLKARVARALDAAHRLGIVHRDISSDNLILPAGDVRLTKVIDFGIARQEKLAEGTIIGGGFAGKNSYASPEQVAGRDVTFKSDIYSFGLVLAEALQGRPIDMGGSMADIVEKRRRVPDLSRIDPGIRPLLQAMLQPNPEDRPAGMSAVAEWSAAPAPAPARTREPAAGGGGKALAAAGVAIVVISLAATAYVFRDDVANLLAPPSAKPPAARPAALEPERSSEPATTPAAPAIPASPSPASSDKGAGETAPAPETSTAPSAPTAAPEAAGGPAKPNPFVELMRPVATEPSVRLQAGVVGTPYQSRLPPFSDPTNKGLSLKALNTPPDGLSFRDLGQGRGEISGTPARPGQTTLEIEATNTGDQRAEMQASIEIRQPERPEPVHAAPSAPASAEPTPKASSVAALPEKPAPQVDAREFSRRYDGGPCFLIRPADAGSGAGELQGFAGDREAAARFENDYLGQFGRSPRMNWQSVDGPQCPTLELLRLAGDSPYRAPRLAMSAEVGPGKPLEGVVSGIAGRKLSLFVIKYDDGGAFPIPYNLDPSGDTARFNRKFASVDPEDVGHAFAVVAVASDVPIPLLLEKRLGPANELVPRLMREWAASGASADAAFARLAR